MVTIATNDNDDSQRDESQEEILPPVQMIDNDFQLCSGKNNINDENDDDSSDSTSASSTSTSSSSMLQHTEGNNHHEIMTLSERRAQNIERNHKILLELGMMNYSGIGSKRKKSFGSHRRFKDSAFEATTTIEDCNDETSHRPSKSSRGIIMPSCWSVMEQQQKPERERQNDLNFDPTLKSSTLSSSSMEQLLHRYPSRSIQIRKLYSLLLVPIMPEVFSSSTTATSAATTSITTSFVSPPPIIITGPTGCGKTSIVRDVVQQCCSNHEFVSLSKRPKLVLHAYIDCLTLDHVTVDEFVSSAYTQWFKQIPQRNKDGRNHKANINKSKTIKNVSPDQKKGKVTVNSTTKLISRTRRGNLNSSSNSNGMDRWQGQSVQHPQRNSNGSKIVESPIHSITAAQNTILTSMWMFGRSIQSLLNRICNMKQDSIQSSTGNVPFILIVDHAEILLSMGATYSKTNASDRINLLVQLLLLPRTLGINLSIILITKNIHLQHAALNKMTSQGTILGHISPITIHFPAYRGRKAIQTILLQEHVNRLIVGIGVISNSSFLETVYRSFVETLLQALYDITSDIKEYIRLGRGLWPMYISPVSRQNISSTISLIQHSKISKGLVCSGTNVNMVTIQRDILSLLDQKIFPLIRYTLEHGLGVLSFDSSGISNFGNITKANEDDLPILVKYLFLAAFICHSNRQDKDKQLFTIERNGRKRRKTKEADVDEEAAYGIGSQQDQVKTIRPKTFPMERLYSLYVSIVSLQQSKNDDQGIDNDELLRSLGSVQFLNTVTHLRDIGILHDFPKRSTIEPIRYSHRQLWTSITREEAEKVANSIKFPLDKYIL